MNGFLTTLVCVLLLPGTALAKPHHHHARAHHKPARHHRVAASTGGLHVAGFLHPPGSNGGTLAVEDGEGAVDLAFVGENTKVRCGGSGAGPFTACSVRNLIVGTRVADAHHELNARGYDVWTTVDLVTDDPLTDPPATTPSSDEPPAQGSGDDAPPPPAPEQHPAPPAVAVVDSYDPDSRMLVVHRLNNNEKPTGRVADDVSVTCVYVKDGKLSSTKMCDTDVLTPGAQIAGYAVTTVDGAPMFTKIYVLIAGS